MIASFSFEEGETIVFPTLYECIYRICVGKDLIEYGKNKRSLQALAVLHRIEECRSKVHRLDKMMESINLVAQIAKLIELDSLPLREIVKCIKELSQSLNRLKTIKDPEKLQRTVFKSSI